jgi:hypothetical protein
MQALPKQPKSKYKTVFAFFIRLRLTNLSAAGGLQA